MKMRNSFLDGTVISVVNDIYTYMVADSDEPCMTSYASCKNHCCIDNICRQITDTIMNNSAGWNDVNEGNYPENQVCLLLSDNMNLFVAYYSQDLVICDDITLVHKPIASHWLTLSGCPISDYITHWSFLPLSNEIIRI